MSEDLISKDWVNWFLMAGFGRGRWLLDTRDLLGFRYDS